MDMFRAMAKTNKQTNKQANKQTNKLAYALLCRDFIQFKGWNAKHFLSNLNSSPKFLFDLMGTTYRNHMATCSSLQLLVDGDKFT